MEISAGMLDALNECIQVRNFHISGCICCVNGNKYNSMTCNLFYLLSNNYMSEGEIGSQMIYCGTFSLELCLGRIWYIIYNEI